MITKPTINELPKDHLYQPKYPLHNEKNIKYRATTAISVISFPVCHWTKLSHQKAKSKELDHKAKPTHLQFTGNTTKITEYTQAHSKRIKDNCTCHCKTKHLVEILILEQIAFNCK